MTKEILRQALDALRDIDRDDNDRDFLSAAQCYMVDAAIAALQAAIDAPEPEPVAHIRQTYIVGNDGELLGVSDKKELRLGRGSEYAHCTPLYTHPPAVREPITQERAEELAKDHFCRTEYDNGNVHECYEFSKQELEKFAELIILECERVSKDPQWYDESPSSGRRNPIRHVCKTFKEHFGVE